MQRYKRYQDEAFYTELLNLSQKQHQHQFEAFSKINKPLVDTGSLHRFLAAVNIAFAQQYPLILSPDFVWLCLIQGLAFHVNANAEQLRHHFVENVLFPYIQDWKTEAYTFQNNYVSSWSKAMNKSFSVGPSTKCFPVGLSKVPFVWKYYDLMFDMEFIGGFVGVTQDQQTLALRPEIGWAVLDVTQPNN